MGNSNSCHLQKNCLDNITLLKSKTFRFDDIADPKGTIHNVNDVLDKKMKIWLTELRF